MKLPTFALALFLGACSSIDDAYYRVGIAEPPPAGPSFHEEAIISLWELYTQGHCGEEYSILDNQNIFTPSCGLSEADLRARLSGLVVLADHEVFASSREEYERALARNDRMRIN